VSVTAPSGAAKPPPRSPIIPPNARHPEHKYSTGHVMQPITASDTTAWYLIHTKPRQERIALTNLERQGYTCYLPLLRVEKIRRRKAEVVSEPLFARYLFVRLDTSDNGPSWAPIRSTLGVSQLVRFGTRPAKVEDHMVDLLRDRELAQPTEALFSQGDMVVGIVCRRPMLTLPRTSYWHSVQSINGTMPQQRAMVMLHILRPKARAGALSARVRSERNSAR
jgi:transcription elongation factor/antiterminator RfaH